MDRFVSVDWGTSRLRVRLVERAGGKILASTESDLGVAVVAAAGPSAERAQRFDAALEDALAGLPSAEDPEIPVVISGMASSSIGWCELPYADTPFSLDGSGARARTLSAFRSGRPIHLLAGVRTETDVMRGEETEAMGLWHRWRAAGGGGNPMFVLPGTHSKHLSVADGAVESITTFMTGELFAVAGRHTVLRHTVAPDADHFDEAAFRRGVEKAQTLPLAAALFQTRSLSLLGQLPEGCGSSFLSGILIGHEMAALPVGRPIVLAGTAGLRRRYATALDSLGRTRATTVVPDGDSDCLAIRGQMVWLDRRGF